MGQKVNPIGFRTGINKDWEAKWFARKNDFGDVLNNDIKIDSGRQEAETFAMTNKTESRGRLDEMRNRSRHDKLAFEIRDFRTAPNNTQTQNVSIAENIVSRVTGEGSVREITLELRLPDYNAGTPGQAAQTTWEVRAANTGSATVLENMLARELHQSFNGDIVRHASMALRDGGEGIIRLALRPESLGNVKIHLNLTENKITGHIFVDSEEALNAFRREIAALEEAFKDAGYSEASLNLSLTADGGSQWRELAEEMAAPMNAASNYESSLREIDGDSQGMQQAALAEVFFGRKSALVNLHA